MHHKICLCPAMTCGFRCICTSYTHIHICSYSYLYLFVFICIFVCIHIYICLYSYSYLFVFIFIIALIVWCIPRSVMSVSIHDTSQLPLSGSPTLIVMQSLRLYYILVVITLVSGMDVLICDLGWQRIPVLQRYLCFETVNLLHKEAVQILQCLAKLSFAFGGFYRAVSAQLLNLSPTPSPAWPRYCNSNCNCICICICIRICVCICICICIRVCICISWILQSC